MAYSSVKAMLNVSRQNNQPLWDIILQSDLLESGLTRPQSLAEMHHLWQVMVQTSDNYCGADRSASGFAGGDAAKVAEAEARGQLLTGGYLAQVMAEALKTAECNACMKRIVAAPTAGSCGVLPAVLLPYQAREGLDDNTMVRAMYVAGAIGQVVAAKASIAGAAGGCGAALAGVLRADLRRGIDTVLDLCGFDALVPGCSLVVTGEGRVDGQTAKYGKVPAGVLARCGDVPCAVLTGCVGPEAERLLAMGNCMIFPIADRPMTLEYAMEHAEALAASAADRLFWALGAFR